VKECWTTLSPVSCGSVSTVLSVTNRMKDRRRVKSFKANGSEGSEPLWWLTKDGDAACYEMFERHYSSDKNRNRKIRQFVGPGESIVLRTLDARAVFVWRRFIDQSGQRGVNCAFFRNESGHTSSVLIGQADRIADFVWPGCRHYTYVDAKRIRSTTNPGFCFLAAGLAAAGIDLSLAVPKRQTATR
jgi:hypothetical protein